MTGIALKLDGLGVFDKIKKEAGEHALRAAMVAGGKIIRDQAQANIDGMGTHPHNRTGVLKANVIIKHLDEESDTGARQTYKITVRHGKGVKEGDAYYWRWVEEGHSRVGPFKFKLASQTRKAYREMHRLEYGDKAVPPHPYLRPALHEKRDEAIAAISARFAEKLNEAINK